MKLNIFYSIGLLSAQLLCSLTSEAQVSSVKANLAKTAVKKGVYGGTFQQSNDNITVLYMTSDGPFAYEFDASPKFVKEHQGGDAVSVFSTVTDESLDANNAGIKQFNQIEVLYTGASWGAMKLERRIVSVDGDDKFIYGFDYKKLEDKKLKAEGTWRTVPIGTRAIIPEGYEEVALKAKNGHHLKYKFHPMGPRTATPANGHIQTVGIITEKVSITNPPPYNQNRMVVFKIGGKDLEETNTIHIMPYAMQSLGMGVSARDNFIAMTMPLHAPSTVKEQKALVAPEENRNNLYIYEIGKDNQIVSEAVHKSDLRTVNYQALPTTDKTYIVGTGAEGRNWRAGYVGQSAMSGVSIIVMDKNGSVSNSRTYLEKELAAKYEVAGTGKGKLQKFTGGPIFHTVEKLPNGNTFLYGGSNGFLHGILLSASDELIKYYVFPRADIAKFSPFTEQLKVQGNNVYLLVADQPHELSNAVKTDVSDRWKSTSQSFEIYHVSQLYTIDGNSGKSTKLELKSVQKDFYTLGNTPAYFTKTGIYIPGRVKPHGKEISVIKVPY